MNVLRYISPDHASGRLLLAMRGYGQACAMLIRNPTSANARRIRQALRLQPRYTMMSTQRLVALQSIMQRLEDAGVKGDVVECGVWNGGSAAMIASAAANAGRHFWLYDSFEGLPPPTERDGKHEHNVFSDGLCRGEPSRVHEAFRVAGADPARLTITKGWFDQTLPESPVTRISLLHIDADWYDPVTLALTTFIDRVGPGGIVAVDDYGVWQGCRDAVDDFLASRNWPPDILRWVDRGMVYFERPD